MRCSWKHEALGRVDLLISFSGSEHQVNKILLIDDDEDILVELKELVMLLGFVCCSARNTQLALVELERHPDIALIISDLRMPDQSGLRLLQILNERYTDGQRIPIIITSGHADMDDVITLFRNGAADFLPKPIHYEHLVEQLERFFPAHEMG